MIPTYENMAKQAVVRVFNAIMTRAGITLIVTVAFSISSMFYNISTDYPFFMVAFLQIICFAGIYMKLGELMSMFSLNANDSQQIGRRIFRRPMVFMRHRARRMEHRIARLSVLEVLQVRWQVQVLPEPESQQRTNRQRNGKILLPAWEAVSVLR